MNSSLQKKTKNGVGDISSRASQWGPKRVGKKLERW